MSGAILVGGLELSDRQDQPGRRLDVGIEDLLEVRPAAGATTSYPFVTLEWAEQWPCEEVWKARRCA